MVFTKSMACTRTESSWEFATATSWEEYCHSWSGNIMWSYLIYDAQYCYKSARFRLFHSRTILRIVTWPAFGSTRNHHRFHHRYRSYRNLYGLFENLSSGETRYRFLLESSLPGLRVLLCLRPGYLTLTLIQADTEQLFLALISSIPSFLSKQNHSRLLTDRNRYRWRDDLHQNLLNNFRPSDSHWLKSELLFLTNHRLLKKQY